MDGWMWIDNCGCMNEWMLMDEYGLIIADEWMNECGCMNVDR